jgi:NADPH:quinone reductase-like Zn-dependent oxidoreductase
MRRPTLSPLLLSVLALGLPGLAVASERITHDPPCEPLRPGARAFACVPARPTMKAVHILFAGDLATLRSEDVPRPVARQGEVLIRVHAAGVNAAPAPAAPALAKGEARSKAPARTPVPLVLGWDVSGVVEEVGPGVTGLRKGDAVYGHPGALEGGTYTPYVAARADAVALKPRSLGHVQAAAVPLAGLAAWQALYEVASLKRGQTVLVLGASSAEGTLAVQLARARGARVIATGAAHELAVLQLLGADHVLDTAEARGGRPLPAADVVLDTAGGAELEAGWRAVKPGGVLVSMVETPSAERAQALGVRAARVTARPDAAQLAQLAGLIDAGELAPHVSNVLPLSEAHRAHGPASPAAPRGKLVLRVGG